MSLGSHHCIVSSMTFHLVETSTILLVLLLVRVTAFDILNEAYFDLSNEPKIWDLRFPVPGSTYQADCGSAYVEYKQERKAWLKARTKKQLRERKSANQSVVKETNKVRRGKRSTIMARNNARKTRQRQQGKHSTNGRKERNRNIIYHWYKRDAESGVEVRVSERDRISFNLNGRELMITDLHSEDYGEYICRRAGEKISLSFEINNPIFIPICEWHDDDNETSTCECEGEGTFGFQAMFGDNGKWMDALNMKPIFMRMGLTIEEVNDGLEGVDISIDPNASLSLYDYTFRCILNRHFDDDEVVESHGKKVLSLPIALQQKQLLSDERRDVVIIGYVIVTFFLCGVIGFTFWALRVRKRASIPKVIEARHSFRITKVATVSIGGDVPATASIV